MILKFLCIRIENLMYFSTEKPKIKYYIYNKRIRGANGLQINRRCIEINIKIKIFVSRRLLISTEPHVVMPLLSLPIFCVHL